MPKRIDTEEFKKRLAKMQPNLEVVSEYINDKSEIWVRCKIHDYTFRSKPVWLRHGQGCQKCYDDRRGNTTRKTKEKFIEEARKLHGDKYDYSKVEYKNNRTPVTIICPIHGEFQQKPLKHLLKQGCPKCGDEYNASLKRMSLEEFIRRAKEKHGNKYNYSKVEYKNCDTPVTIICPIHGEFEQKPYFHLKGQGCPKCNSSHLENETRLVLEGNGIEFEEQKKFDWLGTKSLDFYIPSKKIAIECQGGQHFHSVEHYGGQTEFEKRLSNDITKNNLCQENGVKILYVVRPQDKKYLSQRKFLSIYKTSEVILSDNLNSIILYT